MWRFISKEVPNVLTVSFSAMHFLFNLDLWHIYFPISPVRLCHHHYPKDLHLLHIDRAVCHLWHSDAERGAEDECRWRSGGAGRGAGWDKEERRRGEQTQISPHTLQKLCNWSVFVLMCGYLTPHALFKHVIWPLIGWFSLHLQLQRYKMANGASDVEAGGTATMLPQRKWHSVISPIFIQALTLTFLAEWGDRSQLATIVLAAREVRDIKKCIVKQIRYSWIWLFWSYVKITFPSGCHNLLHAQ